MTSNYVSILDCFHTIELDPPPRDGDEVYCSKCGDYRLVAIVSAEWCVRCEGCRFGRKYGADESAARRAADNHAASRLHDVQLRVAGHQVELVRPATGAPLPGVLQWIKDHPEHQASLRRSP